MKETEIALIVDAVERTKQFRIKLTQYMEINRTTLDSGAFDIMSQAYSLIGNLQYRLLDVINEANK